MTDDTRKRLRVLATRMSQLAAHPLSQPDLHAHWEFPMTDAPQPPKPVSRLELAREVGSRISELADELRRIIQEEP